MKTYEEALEEVRDFAKNMKSLIRTQTITNGTFILIGHFFGSIYGVPDEKIIEDFQIEKNGITYKLIDIERKE